VIEDVDLKNFIENFVSLVRADFGTRGISVECRDLSFKGLAKCDSRALHQVMLNLFANAADAVAESVGPSIRVSLTEGRNSAILMVEDNGRGMSERQIANLFKPFYTSKPDGSGLGLVIVRKMLASMGGTIEIESCPGKGTKATIVLRTGGGN
jgi:signal transduction histidine kinase